MNMETIMTQPYLKGDILLRRYASQRLRHDLWWCSLDNNYCIYTL